MKSIFKKILLITLYFVFLIADTHAIMEDESIAKIVRKTGIVEYSKSTSTRFSFADSSTILANACMLKTKKLSYVAINLSTGAKLYLGERSKVRIELSSSKSVNLLIVSLFTGEVFIQTPDETDEKTVYQMQTKLSVVECATASTIGLRSTGNRGETEILILKGNPTLRSVALRKQFIATGQEWINVLENTAFPTSRRKADAKEIMNVWGWIDKVAPGIVGIEIDKATSLTERERAILSERLNGPIIVLKFKDVSGFMGSWDISSSLAINCASMMKRINIPVEYVPLDHDSPLPDSVVKKAGALLKATVYSLDYRRASRMVNDREVYTQKFDAEIGYDLVSPSTGRIISSFRKDVSLSADEKEGKTWKEIREIPFDLENASFAQTFPGANFISILTFLNNKVKSVFGL